MNIQEARSVLGLTVTEVSSATSASKSFIKKIDSGDQSSAFARLLRFYSARYANDLIVRVDNLLSGHEAYKGAMVISADILSKTIAIQTSVEPVSIVFVNGKFAPLFNVSITELSYSDTVKIDSLLTLLNSEQWK